VWRNMIGVGERCSSLHVKSLGVVLCADGTKTFTNQSPIVGHLKKYIHLKAVNFTHENYWQDLLR
jgi:hypothetical protein